MIQTTIARIFSPTHVVLAAGSEQGVREGMQFVIYQLGDVIADPETAQPLGQLEWVKGRLKVTHVQEKMSHATTLSRSITRMVEPFPFGEITRQMAPFLKREVSETVYDQLKVEGANDLKADVTVRVGDRARSIDE